MSERGTNRLIQMDTFVRVFELGSFSAAARAQGRTPSTVSKLIKRLEARLGVRLFNRSTRGLAPTQEAVQFYQRSTRLLADLEAAERGLSDHDDARGHVHINTNVPFGHHRLIPLLPRLRERHPGLTVALTLTDQIVDLVQAQADIAVRAGPLPNSTLVARHLCRTPMRLVASQDYLRRRGTPQRASDLADHDRLGPTYMRATGGWPVGNGQRIDIVTPDGPVQASDGESLRHMALHGLGITRLAAFQVDADIRTGRLVRVLAADTAEDSEAMHAVYLGKRPLARVPARVTAVLDFLTEALRDC
ncbi:LysR family transcriptional regulator [Salinisphaera sp. T5B8]|uniref:LysR family transcriptional regulator n=1 Tax=Salinisphaera sp. T5B8 TaxID=1304154 RepID=UPI00333F5568